MSKYKIKYRWRDRGQRYLPTDASRLIAIPLNIIPDTLSHIRGRYGKAGYSWGSGRSLESRRIYMRVIEAKKLGLYDPSLEGGLKPKCHILK